MASKLLFFTGAPEANSLRWDADARLLDEFEERVARFAGNDSHPSNDAGDDSSFIQNVPYWRSLPLDRHHLPTGVSQDIWKEGYQGAQFFAPSYIDTFLDEISTQGGQASSLQSVDAVLSQFYEESYGVHQDIASSQIDAVSQSTTSFITEESPYDASESFGSLRSTRQQTQNIPFVNQLTNLKDIPNAAYLSSINPQTMTVNLIVGIVSNPEPRTIRTRRGANVKLIEIIAGDDTKSGFGINFWLSSTESAFSLTNFRPQDVVLMRNVALSSFRERVYGQSLRKDVTKVHLLYRKRLDKSDAGGCYGTADFEAESRGDALLEKTKRVNGWVQQFVGPAPSRKGRAVDKVFKEILPPDTPPSQV